MPVLQRCKRAKFRGLYPGEIDFHVDAGGASGANTFYPSNISIELLYWDSKKGSMFDHTPAPGRNKWVLISRGNVSLALGLSTVGAITAEYIDSQLAGLSSLVGDEVAAEFNLRAKSCLAKFNTRTGSCNASYRFRNLALFNDMIANLEDRYFGADRVDVLKRLLRAWRGKKTEAGAQLAWYQANRPTAPGTERDNFDAEAADFAAMVEASRKIAEEQLASAIEAQLTSV